MTAIVKNELISAIYFGCLFGSCFILCVATLCFSGAWSCEVTGRIEGVKYLGAALVPFFIISILGALVFFFLAATVKRRALTRAAILLLGGIYGTLPFVIWLVISNVLNPPGTYNVPSVYSIEVISFISGVTMAAFYVSSKAMRN